MNSSLLVGFTKGVDRGKQLSLPIPGADHESHARMEKMIEMGFQEGFTTSMTNLENLWATSSKK